MALNNSENQAQASNQKPWGRIIGTLLGLSFAGIWGGVFGFIVGGIYDRQKISFNNAPASDLWANYQNFSAHIEQATFTMGVIVLSAKMARADGRVSREEINAFKRVFDIKPHQEDAVGRLFNRARLSPDGFEPYAIRLAQVFRNRPLVLEEVLSGLFMIGVADSGTLDSAEIVFLKRVSLFFGFDSEAFARIAARSGVTLPESERPRPQTPEAFVLLGVAETATETEIKTAYRALIREHHPDKLMAQGMPPEFIAAATEKMKRINVAYDTVCRLKGIR